MRIQTLLHDLSARFNRRTLPQLRHEGNFVLKDGKKLLNLASNDYLNLAQREDLRVQFLSQFEGKIPPFSASSSRSLSGNFAIYEAFEGYLGALFGGREVLHFNSGYHCNLSCIAALATLPETLFLCDKFAHASIIDGLRLSGAKFFRFRHNDVRNLELLLEKHHKNYKNFIIISEALFSMEGDFARLRDLIALKKRFGGVYLYLDEAHSVGCFGEGLGWAAELGLAAGVDFLVLTFGKALASVGACMVAAGGMRDFFINTARGLIYSTALPPINVAWSLFVFKKMREFEGERKRLLALASAFKKALEARGGLVLGEAYILSLILGDNQRALEFAAGLEKSGFFAPAIRSPTVPQNGARIRFSLHSGLEMSDLEGILALL